MIVFHSVFGKIPWWHKDFHYCFRLFCFNFVSHFVIESHLLDLVQFFSSREVFIFFSVSKTTPYLFIELRYLPIWKTEICKKLLRNYPIQTYVCSPIKTLLLICQILNKCKVNISIWQFIQKNATYVTQVQKIKQRYISSRLFLCDCQSENNFSLCNIIQ